jgi:hypothetical protein
MRFGFKPGFENLEPHVLLSGSVPSAVPASLTPGVVTIALKTDRSGYQVGDPVLLKLTETNTSNHDVRIVDGPSIDGFSVTQNGATIWRSNARIQPLFLVAIDLKPGQSHTLSARWDGHTEDAWGNKSALLPTGTFAVHNQLQPIGSNPDTILIQPPTVQPLDVSVQTDRASYAVGQPVTITVTEMNRSNHDVTVLTGGQILTASVSGDRGVVWVYHDPRRLPTGHGVLYAGQSRRFTIVWDGHPSFPFGGALPGTYTIAADIDSVVGTTKIRLL